MANYVWQKRDNSTMVITTVELSVIQNDFKRLGYPDIDDGSYFKGDKLNIWRSFDHPHWVRITKEYCYRKHAIR